MEKIDPTTFWTVVLAVALAISTIAGAAEKIAKAWKAAKAPNVEQNERLDALEAWQREVDGRLNNDNERLGGIDEGNRVTQRAIIALLDHGIDGNNIKQMQDAKEALQNHLINR